MRACLPGWIVASVVLGVPTTAWSEEAPPYPPCDRTPTEAEVSAAKGAFQAGNASFNEADYERAITYWEDAYRRDCTAHPLLLNLARAYELDEQREKAVVALETYVERNPGSSDEAQIKRRIAKLREQIDANVEATDAPPPPAEEPPVAPPPPPPEPDVSEAPGRPVWPLVVAGVGGAIGITGVVVYAVASSDVSSFEDLCPNRDCTGQPNPDELVDDANAARGRQLVGGVLAIGGFAVGAAGLAYYFLAPPGRGSGAVDGDTRKAATPQLSPWMGPGGAGLQWSGRF